MIKNGNVDDLKKFLSATRPPLKEGRMAGSPLRHAKNIFISTTVKAGMMGAIPGGVDIEKTYQLMDYYVQECEQIRTIEKINQLQYVMLLDFCQRAGDTRIPDGISPDVYACMTYIRNHTNESISVEDAAAHASWRKPKACSPTAKKAWLRSAAISASPASPIFRMYSKSNTASRRSSTGNRPKAGQAEAPESSIAIR